MRLSKIRQMWSLQEGGFSIVELLVAVVILVFVSIALMQTAIVNIEFNAKNAIRDEGVRLAGETIRQMRTAPFANVTAGFNGTSGDVLRRVRNIEMTYTVTNTVSDIGVLGKKMETFVEWAWRGEVFNTSISSVR